MLNYGTKIDNNETSAGVVVAKEYNSIMSEQKNTVLPFLQLDELDNKQQVKAIDIASKAIYYSDTGTVNNIVLSRGATTESIETLFEGMVIMFTPANINTGATTLKVKTLDAKPLYYNGSALTAGFLSSEKTYIAIYSAVDGRFNIQKNFSAGAEGGGVLNNAFSKSVTRAPLLQKVNASTVKVPLGTSVVVNGETVTLETDTNLSLDANLDTGIKTAGTDYYVYVKTDGTLYLSANNNTGIGRVIGGFHYGLTGEAEVATGNKTEAVMAEIRGINKNSFWDLTWLPANGDARGMHYKFGIWVDIYQTDEDYGIRGYSKAGGKIAGGTIEYGRGIPKIPLVFGGDGTLTYGKYTWFQASEVGKAFKKRLLKYEEFIAFAYGVDERKSSLTNGYETVAGKIEHYPNLTSSTGMEQATGVQWIWGADFGTSSSGSWNNIADGRGDVYTNANPVVLGGNRDDAGNAGSRCSYWFVSLSHSHWRIGSRFACDHLILD